MYAGNKEDKTGSIMLWRKDILYKSVKNPKKTIDFLHKKYKITHTKHTPPSFQYKIYITEHKFKNISVMSWI